MNILLDVTNILALEGGRRMSAKENLANDVKKYIGEHYKEKYSLSKLADSLYVNEYYLARVFKEVTGETPLQCHNKVRCKKAADMLINTDRSVSFIASDVGYQTASHFSRIFKKIYGKNPRAYRNAAVHKSQY